MTDSVRVVLGDGTLVHFVGIGGARMNALAQLLLEAGHRVSGSDLRDSPALAILARNGARVVLGHLAENVDGAKVVVRSPAVRDDNVEIARARELGIPILKGSEVLGLLSRDRRCLAVAGTAGKTTTSSMLALILDAAGLDPTVVVGAAIPKYQSGARWGKGAFLVAEADEFDRAFHHLHPEIAVVTNVEVDHLDYFGTPQAIVEAFELFAAAVPTEGWIVACADDAGSRQLAETFSDRSVTYGLSDAADWQAMGLSGNALGGTDFVVYVHDTLVGQFRLAVPGRHNVSNALAAALAAGRVGVDFTTAAHALEAFVGVERRLERKGEAGGITVFDDYAHHPTKIRASLAALREHHDGRIIALFQPHTYHRLESLFDNFVAAFGDADRVVVSDVYAPAGRGPADGERTSKDLALAVPGRRAVYGGDLASSVERIVAMARYGDVVVTMGAGDVTIAGPEILRALTRSQVNP